MAKVSYKGKEYNLPKETDVIIDLANDTITVQCQAKKGSTTYPHFMTYDSMVKAEGKEKVLAKYNEKRRVDAVNGINRPSKTPSEIKALREGRASLSADKQKLLDKDLAALLGKYTQEQAKAEITKK